MKDELVSIIVPVYNSERFLKDTIGTIQAQTYMNWEALFIDDCSHDNSVNILKKYQKKDNRIKIFKQEKNGGAALARNKGICEASGRYICFLDSDDLWDKNKLKIQVNFINKSKAKFVYTSYEFANENGIANGKKVIVPDKISYKQALKNTTIWTSTVMFDMNYFSKEDIFMPNVKRGQDTATWWKILKKINYAYGIKNIIAFYRRTGESLSANKLTALKRTWNLYRNVEHLNFFLSCYNFCYYCINAIKRRI